MLLQLPMTSIEWDALPLYLNRTFFDEKFWSQEKVLVLVLGITSGLQHGWPLGPGRLRVFWPLLNVAAAWSMSMSSSSSSSTSSRDAGDVCCDGGSVVSTASSVPEQSQSASLIHHYYTIATIRPTCRCWSVLTALIQTPAYTARPRIMHRAVYLFTFQLLLILLKSTHRGMAKLSWVHWAAK